MALVVSAASVDSCAKTSTLKTPNARREKSAIGARWRNEFIFIVFLSIASTPKFDLGSVFLVLFKRKGAKSVSNEPGHSFPAQKEPLAKLLKRRLREWMIDQTPLFEASCIALSAHVLAFPIIWWMGWALPWPKSPEIVTIIEINLEHWPLEAIPEKVTDVWRSHMKKDTNREVKK